MKSIRTKILLGIIGLSIIVVLGLSITTFTISRNAVSNEVEEKLERQAMNAGDAIEKITKYTEGLADGMAATVGNVIDSSKAYLLKILILKMKDCHGTSVL